MKNEMVIFTVKNNIIKQIVLRISLISSSRKNNDEILVPIASERQARRVVNTEQWLKCFKRFTFVSLRQNDE